MVSKEGHKKILNVLAIVLLILVIGNFLVNLFFWQDSWTEIFWYCSVASILLSLGILLKNPSLNTIVLVTAIPAQSIWIVDFILNIFNLGGFGRTTWLFELPLAVTAFSVILHFLVIPLALYAVAVHGFKKNVFVGTLITMTVILAGSYFFTSFEDNINCVFYSCDLAFENLEGMPVSFPEIGSMTYFVFLFIRWVFWVLISYSGLLLLFQRVFKRISIV